MEENKKNHRLTKEEIEWLKEGKKMTPEQILDWLWEEYQRRNKIGDFAEDNDEL